MLRDEIRAMSETYRELFKGANLQQNAIGMEKKVVKAFAAIGNPGTGMFVNKMEDMIRIYNRTSEIYFDNENIYLLPRK